MERHIKEKSIVQTCVEKSKLIITAIAARQALKEARFFTNRLPASAFISPKVNISETDKELEVYIDGLRLEIARYLLPIFHAHGVSTYTINPRTQKKEIITRLWFSSNVLRAGYMELCTVEMLAFEGVFDRVLLLVDVYPPLPNMDPIPAGSIISWEVFHKIEKYIVGIPDTNFAMYHARRKSKQNGTQI